MISKLSKFCRFCTVMFVTAVAIVAVLEPQLLIDRLVPPQSTLNSTLQLPELQQIATHTPAQAWSETGATVLPLAAQIMILRNPQGVALDDTQKGYLRPFFGDLVDRVTVVYRAQLLDRWSQGGKETHIGGVDSSAQTYCDRIYIRAGYKSHDTDRLVLLAHELTHAQQCDRAGGIGKFGELYFSGYYHGGQTYQDNPLEKAARKTERDFTRQLCQRLDCPPRGGRYYVNYKGWGIKLPVNM
jgi:Domain of unknown function (DUF4157)